MRWSSARALVAVVALGWLGSTLGGCSDEDVGTESIEEALRANGIDLDELFASPTAAEVAAMRAIWNERELGVVDLREEGAFVLENGDTMRVLSHLVGEQRHYGVVILPAGQHPPASLSVVVSLIGFGVEMVLDVPPDARAYDGTRVTIIPSFRGHELRFAEEAWFSDGDPFDQCDGGSDDAIAFMHAAVEATPEADPSAMVMIGGSRGGNVAMLVGIRRPSIDAVVNIAGPTDYHRRDLLEHVNLSALYANHFLRDLLEGGTDVAEARRRMLACSPIYFAEELPPTQAHHGTADENVPLTQAELLAARMVELGREPPEFELFTYEGADHRLETALAEIEARAEAFLEGSWQDER